MDPKFEKLFDLMKKGLKQNSNSVYKGDDIAMTSVAPYGIPTGLAELDLYLGGKGGYPASKIIELFGFQFCGKTTAALQAAAEWQKRGGLVFFIDSERAFTPKRAAELGCKPEEIIKSEAETVEEIFNHIINLLDSLEKAEFDAPVLIIVDSITGVPTKSDVEGDISENDRVGFEAKQIKRGLKKVNHRLGELKCKPSIIFITHAIKKIVRFGKQSDSGGGYGIKFYSSVRLEFTPLGTIKNKAKDELLGQTVQIQIEKLKGSHLRFYKFNAKLTNEMGFDKYESLKLAMIASSFASRPPKSQVITILPDTGYEAAVRQVDFRKWVDENGGYDKMYQNWRKWAIKVGIIEPWGGLG